MINDLKSAQINWVNELSIVFCGIIHHYKLKPKQMAVKFFPPPFVAFLLNRILTGVSCPKLALKIFILYKGCDNEMRISGGRR